MTAFIASLLFVTLAEMGDKTQLLAMAFATRFPAKTVLADGSGSHSCCSEGSGGS
jgi:putative Ca2+/H+ antiporter (TMEM165/GDT1 family)